MCPGLFESDYVRILCTHSDLMLYIHKKFSMIVSDAVELCDTELYTDNDINTFNTQLLIDNVKTNIFISREISGHLKTVGVGNLIANILANNSSGIVELTFRTIAHGFKLHVKQIQSILSACQINIIDQMDINRDYIIDRLTDLNPESFEVVLNWLSKYIPVPSEVLRRFITMINFTSYWDTKFTSQWLSTVRTGNIYVHKCIYTPSNSVRTLIMNMNVDQIDYILDEHGIETCIRQDMVDMK